VPTMRTAALGQGASACWQRFLAGMVATVSEELRQMVSSRRPQTTLTRETEELESKFCE